MPNNATPTPPPGPGPSPAELDLVMQRLREVDPETAEVFDALIALTAQLVRSLGEHGADETVATFRERFWHDKGLSTPEGRSEALAWLEEQNR